jgi:hypothetical protein
MDKVEMTPTLSPPTPTPRPVEANGTALPPCCATATFPPDVVRSWLRDRRVLAVAGLVIGGSGLALGWGWLTAIGIAPLIVAAAPCLLMCGLGLCMMGRGHQAGSAKPETASEPGTPTDRNASS